MWKQYKTFFARFRFIGYVLMIVGIYLIVNGISDYADQSRQNAWTATAATVTDVSSEVVGSSTHGSSRTYYIMTYKYAVNGETYTGSTERLSSPRLVGDTIPVKYDPDSPEASTATLSPNPHNLAVLLILGTAFAAIGFFFSGVLELLRRLLQKGRTEKPEALSSQEDTGFDSMAIAKTPVKQWAPKLVAWLLVFAATVLFVKFFLTAGAADLDQLRDAATATGYTVSDSTEDLRQSWGVGSMLIRSVSVCEDSLRLDFCKMDSADSCRRIYAAATLPITGEVTERTSPTSQMYAVDSPTNFAAKIRGGSMLLYVFTTQENKSDVLAFLESVGYWDE